MTDNQNTPNVIALAAKFRKALDKADANELNRLIEAYKGIYTRVSAEIDALIFKIQASGEAMTRGQVVKLAQYKQLMETVERELKQYQSFVATEINMTSQAALKMGLSDSEQLVKSVLADANIGISFNQLNPEVVKNLLGFLSPDGPLFERLSRLGESVAKEVSRTIIEMIAMGKNPNVIGREISNVFGMGLTDALRMMRTVQIYSYREATRANYIANSDVVSGWIWYAELDGETCESCISMHGTEHSNDEVLDDHHNGRCAMIPKVGDYNPVEQTGEDWFKQQPENVQRDIMGQGKFDAWKEGKFDFSALSTTRTDDVYGDMRTATSLKDLLGE